MSRPLDCIRATTIDCCVRSNAFAIWVTPSSSSNTTKRRCGWPTTSSISARARAFEAAKSWRPAAYADIASQTRRASPVGILSGVNKSRSRRTAIGQWRKAHDRRSKTQQSQEPDGRDSARQVRRRHWRERFGQKLSGQRYLARELDGRRRNGHKTDHDERKIGRSRSRSRRQRIASIASTDVSTSTR